MASCYSAQHGLLLQHSSGSVQQRPCSSRPIVLQTFMLGATYLDADLSAIYYGAELLTMSVPHRILARHLDVKICGAETCYLGVRTHGADHRIQR